MRPNQFSHRVNQSGFRKSGFTLLELFIVIVIIVILLGMLLPAVRTVGDAARRSTCLNNARQLALATHNFEVANMKFPSAMGPLDLEPIPTHQGANRVSGFVKLLPFMDHANLWNQISKPLEHDEKTYPAGPAPWLTSYPAWKTDIVSFRCPTSSPVETGFGNTNYAFCIGDQARNIHQPGKLRGVFGVGLTATFADLTDGSSNTIMFAEIGTQETRAAVANYAVFQSPLVLDDPSLCLNLVDDSNPPRYLQDIKLGKPARGGTWADGAAGSGLVNTILPPNSPSCAVDGGQAKDGIYSAGSFHPGLVVVAYGDGSVHIIPDSIDAGDSSHPTPTDDELSGENFASPYGVWGAMGTANAGDTVEF